MPHEFIFGEITAIDPEFILIEDRLRPVDAAHVEAIAASINAIGLKQPIIVRPEGNRYRLVAGAHRLAAVQSLGHSSIDAVVEQLDDQEARLVEIDENLMRRELSALDRAIFLAERKAVYDALYTEAKSLGRKPKKMTQTLRQFGESFSEHAAKRTGLAKRTIQLSLQLVNSLAPEAREALRLSDIADNQAELLKLAALEPEKQIEAARLLTSGAASKVKGARVVLGLDVIVEEDPQEKIFQQFLALFGRADQRTKARIADHLAGVGKAKKTKVGDAQ